MAISARLPGALVMLVLLSGMATAQVRETGEIAQQRSEFLAAEEALKRGDQRDYQAALKALGDYPLYPYLEYRELQQKLSSIDAARAQRFLNDHPGTPLADRFQHIWLDELARRGLWQTYIEFYRPTSSPKRRCNYLYALIRTGHAKDAWKEVEALWLSGRSRPDACDPVFDAWRAAGKLDSRLVWQRIELAMDARQTRLARYLGRFLPEQDKDRLQHWLQVDRDPQRILDPADFSEQQSYREQILLHGFKRLARKDADTALAAWNQLERSYPFSQAQRYQAQRALALALISQDHPGTTDQLQRFSPDPGDTRLLETRLRAALSRHDWPLLLTWLEALPENLGSSERWRYWRARALEGVGRTADARGLYQELAGQRSYHGFLAADRVGRAYNLDHTPLSVVEKRLTGMAAEPGIRRARELYYLGRLNDARSEWRFATRDLDPDDLKAAASLAQDWGWLDQAIFTLARTGYWEDLELRFPIAHRSEIDQASGKRELDNAWVFAVLRQESAFAADARSPAGAMGLMQLMPRTARSTARKLKLSPPRHSDLLLPEINIELGTAYLRQVLEQLDGNPVLATAAYNAGPHRVSRWLPDVSAPADLWVETIPFNETRRYTQRVLTYSVIYDQRLGREPRRLQQLMPEVVRETAASSVAAAASGEDGTAL